MDQILMQTAQAVKQMNQPASPGEATREFYRQQGRKQEQERIIELLQADRNESHAIDDIFDGIVFQTLSRAEFKQALIELIKGEK